MILLSSCDIGPRKPTMASDDFFGFLKTKLRVTVFLYSMKQTITILILGFDFDLN